MVIMWERNELKRALKEVRDGRLPAVFHFERYSPFPVALLATPTIRKLRERFPHVTIYKIIITGRNDMEDLVRKMNVGHRPAFHFYQNGKKVDEIIGDYEDRLIDTFGKLYRYAIPVETTQPSSSSGMGKKRTQQLFMQAKKAENGKGVEGGLKLGGAGTFSQWRGGVVLSQESGSPVEAVESTAPSLRQVMQAVESLPGDDNFQLFAKGIFKSQPEKRVMFSNITGFHSKLEWLYYEMGEE